MSKQDLSNIIKRCCDLLRTDDGISGPVHYTEQLSWILYLKFFNDQEEENKSQAKLDGEDYMPILKKQYQWSVWTNFKHNQAGEELINFVNNKLFPYLQDLQTNTEGDPRQVIRAIFKNSTNRVHDGYLLAQVIEEIKKINFENSDGLFTLSHIYEDLLKSMGSGGGNSGEFYTPRPLVKTMVQLLNPKLGETVYDPACGTGGFLAEAYLHLDQQATSVAQRKILNNKKIWGQEKTPLPFVLCLMNLTLHGIHSPVILKTNTLALNIRDIEEHEKHDVILANPPFGGKEQTMLQKNFIFESSATELLFLQHIEKKLKINGRAAVVVPEGVLFPASASYKLFREKLIDHCNMHTVLSLPQGVFIPYSPVKTNVLFFDKTKQTKNIWFYELPLIGGKKLTKKNGITLKHFEEFVQLYPKRSNTKNSWLIEASKVLSNKAILTASTYSPHREQSEQLEAPSVYATEAKGLLQNQIKNIDTVLAELD